MSCKSEVEWPCWSGETCVVVATGKSALDVPLGLAKGVARVITIKQSWKLCPWADVLYGIDRGWWLENEGGKGFAGLKVSPSPHVHTAFPDVRSVKLKSTERVLTEPFGTIGCGLRDGGGYSGFQAINLAIQLGARRLLLVGFDMTLIGGAHWHDDYRGVAPPEHGRVGRWRAAFDRAAVQFSDLGVEVTNCSARSVLTAYPKLPLDEALERPWPASRPEFSPSLVMCS
jgi:hypothetical protein